MEDIVKDWIVSPHLKYSYVEVLCHSISECGYIFKKEPLKKKSFYFYF